MQHDLRFILRFSPLLRTHLAVSRFRGSGPSYAHRCACGPAGWLASKLLLLPPCPAMAGKQVLLLACQPPLACLLLHSPGPEHPTTRLARPRSQNVCEQNARGPRKSAAAGLGALRRPRRESRGVRFAPPGGVEPRKGPQNHGFLLEIRPPATPTLDAAQPGPSKTFTLPL